MGRKIYPGSTISAASLTMAKIQNRVTAAASVARAGPDPASAGLSAAWHWPVEQNGGIHEKSCRPPQSNRIGRQVPMGCMAGLNTARVSGTNPFAVIVATLTW